MKTTPRHRAETDTKRRRPVAKLALVLVAAALLVSAPAQAVPTPTALETRMLTPLAEKAVSRDSADRVAVQSAEGPVTWLPRSAWTKAPVSRFQRLDPRHVTEVVVHHPDDMTNLLGLSSNAIGKKLRGYRAFHMSPARNYDDIAYNYAIDGSGRIWDLAKGRVGAHAAAPTNKTQNKKSVGVPLMLANSEGPNLAMRNAFHDLQVVLERQYPRINGRVIGHQDAHGSSTSCPGKAAEALSKKGQLGVEGRSSVPPFPRPELPA